MDAARRQRGARQPRHSRARHRDRHCGRQTEGSLPEVFLRRHGFEPELASGGAEAGELAATNHYDAILMDLQMPDMDGYMATQRIRAAEPPGQHTPIIALTASIAKSTREKCLAAGVDDQLTKPLALRKFKQLLNSFIDSKET
ncbi:MAG: response regulator [Opitutus sp.]|nr:response regulator [Opitutus sp.]